MMMMIDDDRFTVFVYYYPYYTPRNKQPTNFFSFYRYIREKNKNTTRDKRVKKGAKTSWDFKKQKAKEGRKLTLKKQPTVALFLWRGEMKHTRNAGEEEETI